MSKDYEPFKKFFHSFSPFFSAIKRRLSAFVRKVLLIGPRLRFRRSRFCRANGNITFGQLKKNKGALGEYLLYDKLRRFRGRWLFNLYLPKGEERTEIDSVLFSRRGVFLFESKNFTGRIYGELTQREWFHTFRSDRGIKKQRFFNPLMQNTAHKNAFAALAGTDLPIYPVVVFGCGSELFSPAAGTRADELMKIGGVRRFVRKHKKTGTNEEIDRLFALFKPYTVVTPYQKYKHIEYVAKRNSK